MANTRKFDQSNDTQPPEKQEEPELRTPEQHKIEVGLVHSPFSPVTQKEMEELKSRLEQQTRRTYHPNYH